MKGKFSSLAAAVAGGVFLATAGGASAAPITGDALMQQFNLIVLGDLDSTSEVEGRTYVGGNLGGSSSTYYTRGSQAPASSYDAVTVGGNITGGYKNINGGGNVAVGGNVENMNLNGGSARIGGTVTGNVNGSKQTGATVTIPSFGTVFQDYSGSLNSQTSNSTFTQNSQGVRFAGGGADLSVFSIGADLLSSSREIGFSLGTDDHILINVDGSSLASGSILSLSANFLAPTSTIASNVIWNFGDIGAIDFGTEFWGSILAPDAQLTNRNSLNGSVVAAGFTQRGEVHQPVLDGDFPSPVPNDPPRAISEPAIWPLSALAMAAIAVVGFRRRRDDSAAGAVQA
ncbi:glycosyltransferase family 1 [Salinisphaera orenii MK-B5]|uniref:Glycosyltransferase family 1 n=1 Tax=Salinisphaera orenii MK-B5 TaxID=856730 RepID=A0A423PP93_9GAMM|nr:choice-of-anchor A family protein [Salinisphaera orenii]ROO27400.1 glycosyltransferase family 1 [Salinisphaera orenii MK-B5]